MTIYIMVYNWLSRGWSFASSKGYDWLPMVGEGQKWLWMVAVNSVYQQWFMMVMGQLWVRLGESGDG